MIRYYCKKYGEVINKGKFMNNCLPRGCPEFIVIRSAKYLKKLKKKNGNKR